MRGRAQGSKPWTRPWLPTVLRSGHLSGASARQARRRPGAEEAAREVARAAAERAGLVHRCKAPFWFEIPSLERSLAGVPSHLRGRSGLEHHGASAPIGAARGAGPRRWATSLLAAFRRGGG